jgi:hypothetical protein
MSKADINLTFGELFDKATAGSYEELVELCSEWLDVEAIKEDLKTN